MFGKNFKFSASISFLASVLPVMAFTSKKGYVGIDLGTTFTAAYIFYPDTQTFENLVFDDPTNLTLPSTIYFLEKTDKETMLPYKVGYEANFMNEKFPDKDRYFYGFKRIVGIDKISETSRLINFEKSIEWKIKQGVSASNKSYYYSSVNFDGAIHQFTPTDFSSIILSNIRHRINDMGVNIVKTTISTPAYFTSLQDNEVKEAALMANFGDVIITKEPVAACICYAKDFPTESEDIDEKVLVFDLGGGTADLSILDVNNSKLDKGEFDSFVQVKKTAGDNFLGGENFSCKLTDYLLKVAEEKHGIKPESLTASSKLRLKINADKNKIILCTKNALYHANKPGGSLVHTFTHHFEGTNAPISFTISESLFDELMDEFYIEIEKLLFDEVVGIFNDDTILKKSGDYSMPLLNSVSKVLLIGGSSKIPWIKKFFTKRMPNAKIFDKIDADMAVAKGCCYSSVVSDAASGDTSLLVLHSTTLPIGIRVNDGSFQAIIEQNITIPTSQSAVFTTAFDNQTAVEIEVAMGLRPMFDDNEKIGNFRLNLKNPKPKGVPKINVSIEYFADYSFKVTAVDAETNLSESIVFDSNLGKPSQSKVTELLEAAKKFKESDIELKNRLEQFRLLEAALNLFETQLKEAKEKPNVLSDLDKSYFETILDGNKSWIEQNKNTAKPSVIQSKIEDLKNSANELVAKIQAATSATAGQAETSAKESGRDVL